MEAASHSCFLFLARFHTMYRSPYRLRTSRCQLSMALRMAAALPKIEALPAALISSDLQPSSRFRCALTGTASTAVTSKATAALAAQHTLRMETTPSTPARPDGSEVIRFSFVWQRQGLSVGWREPARLLYPARRRFSEARRPSLRAPALRTAGLAGAAVAQPAAKATAFGAAVARQ